jgi:hypothetical protein
MRTLREMARSLRDARRGPRAKLPWRALEAEAARQGCSPADIFFDRAGGGAAEPEPAPGQHRETDRNRDVHEVKRRAGRA